MNKNIRSTFILASISCSLATFNANSEETHWSYQGKFDPSHWGEVNKDYALCTLGKQQSPIDITASIKADLPPLVFNYQPIPLVIENNGHSIKVATDKAGSLIFGNHSYQLIQFHYHAPSEEAIAGKRADMVIHLVHQNEAGKLAVVAVLLNQGASNPLIEQLLTAIPKTQSKPQQHEEITIDITQLLPTEKEYYTFWGSLTTPPCSEEVRWIVLKQPLTLSTEQLAQFQAVYNGNARPLQPVGARDVLSSN